MIRLPSLAPRRVVPLLLLAAMPVWAQSAAPAIQLRAVTRSPVASALMAEAVIEATRQATVAAQVAGRVVELRVDAGQRVERGQLLLRLDARESAEAVAAARAALTNAQANFERTERLRQQQYLSEAALDRARADLRAARAQYEASQAGQSHAVLRAPISGVVAYRHIELGEMAAPGRSLVTLFAPGGLRAVASVPQSQLGALRRATSAVVEFAESGRRIASREMTILPAADAATHAMTVRVALPEAGAAGGPAPGMAARIYFIGDEIARMTVPEGAVVRRGAVTGVYVQGADGRLGLRQVRLGEVQANGELEVLAGLAVGEHVALDAVTAAIALKQATREH